MLTTGSLPIPVTVKLTTVLFITCSLKGTGSEAETFVITHLPTGTPVLVSLPRTLFFHVEALPGCPPQQNSKSHLVFDSSYLSMENALKLLIFSIFHMHTSIFFSIFIYTHKCILVLHM